MSNLSSVFGGHAFDSSQVEPTTQFDVLPKGKYMVIITDSEVKETKDRTGKYLQLTHEIVDGQFKGRKLWNRLNIVNRSKEAEDIAHRNLSSLCRAAGVAQLADSSQLHNIPVIADVKISKDGEQNDVMNYASTNGQASAPRTGGFTPPKQSAAPTSTDSTTSDTPAQSASSTPPWKRK